MTLPAETVPVGKLWTKRPAFGADADFIVYCWLQSYKRSPPTTAMGANRYRAAHDRYWEGHERIVHRLLERCETTVAEAKSPEGIPVIVGFTCREPGVVHYVLSRRGFQRMGIARDLLADILSQKDILYSHMSATRGLILPEGWAYSPYEAIKYLE